AKGDRKAPDWGQLSVDALNRHMSTPEFTAVQGVVSVPGAKAVDPGGQGRRREDRGRGRGGEKGPAQGLTQRPLPTHPDGCRAVDGYCRRKGNSLLDCSSSLFGRRQFPVFRTREFGSQPRKAEHLRAFDEPERSAVPQNSLLIPC